MVCTLLPLWTYRCLQHDGVLVFLPQLALFWAILLFCCMHQCPSFAHFVWVFLAFCSVSWSRTARFCSREICKEYCEHFFSCFCTLWFMVGVSLICTDVYKATTPKAKGTYLKAKNATTFPQHLYRTINVLISNLQSSLEINQCSVSIVIRLN